MPEPSPEISHADPPTDDHDLIRSLEGDSDSLWHDYPLFAWLTLLGPAVLTVVLLLLLDMAVGWDSVRRLVTAAVVTFFALGRFVILGGHPDSSTAAFSAGELAVLVFYMDIMTAIIVSCHAGILFRIPWLGERIQLLMDSGRSVLAENRWMKRATFGAVVAFVMFPLASSGSVGGSLFGRLLGLSRIQTFTGVVIGSFLGCATMYYGATIINRYVSPDNVVLRWGGIVAIVVLLAVLNRRYKTLKRSQSPTQ